jgi:hypothetical protein
MAKFLSEDLAVFPGGNQFSKQPRKRSKGKNPQKGIIENIHRAIALYSQSSFLFDHS